MKTRCLCLLVFLCGTHLCAAEPADGERLFTLQVLPLLRSKCFACHGTDAKQIKGKLNMLSRGGLLKGGESGEASLVPGKPAVSLLIKAVRWDGYEMPPKENDRLSEPQIKQIERWIAAGAPWPDEKRQQAIRAEEWSRPVTADGVLVKTSGGLSDQWTYRRYAPADLWAYRPIERVEPPVIPGVKHAIDAFVTARLNKAGLKPAPAADRRTLIRRATFGLTGLPPTAAEIDAFLADNSKAAWAKLIARLLASRHYGERMAQHWLDVVRYADTAGFSNDWERPHAWRYRDYVIRSFNSDKPFDRFVVEQIAGDELEPQNPELKVAAGFLRAGPWEHTGMSVAAVTRQLWLDDVTNAVGEAFLGHTLRCAKCHDHKFDPIPTRDYYRMQAIFAATQFDEPPASFSQDENRRGAEERLAVWRKQFSSDGVQAGRKLQSDNAFTRVIKKLQAYRKLALARYQPKAMSVRNGKSEQVAILVGGALERPSDKVEPGLLSAVSFPGNHVIFAKPNGRRLALARWIADSRNPLTARVIVNRVWQWHFGRGLTATPNNFGGTGSKPTHPQLLDHLAGWFIDNGYSIKKLHRYIMTSETYRRSSRHPDPAVLERLDPQDELLARFRPRRLTAEEISDAMLAATGELSPAAGGPGVFPEINWEVALQPRHIMGGIAPPYRPSLTPGLRNRRTIYAFRYRTLANPMLEVLNRPNADVSCERRDETTVATQAFALFNGRFAHNRSVALASRIAKSAKDDGDRIRAAFQLTYGRQPTDAERELCLAHLHKSLAHHRRNRPPRVAPPQTVKREMIAEQTGVLFHWTERMFLEGYKSDLQPADVDAATRALADVCLALLNSSEFVYVY